MDHHEGGIAISGPSYARKPPKRRRAELTRQARETRPDGANWLRRLLAPGQGPRLRQPPNIPGKCAVLGEDFILVRDKGGPCTRPAGRPCGHRGPHHTYYGQRSIPTGQSAAGYSRLESDAEGRCPWKKKKNKPASRRAGGSGPQVRQALVSPCRRYGVDLCLLGARGREKRPCCRRYACLGKTMDGRRVRRGRDGSSSARADPYDHSHAKLAAEFEKRGREPLTSAGCCTAP